MMRTGSKITVSVKKGFPLQEKSDCLILPIFEGLRRGRDRRTQTLQERVDRTLGGTITQLQKEGEITGKWKEITLLHTYPADPARGRGRENRAGGRAKGGSGSAGRIPAKRVMVIGLGKEKEFTLDRLRRVSGVAAKRTREIGVRRVTMSGDWSNFTNDPLPITDYAQSITEGILLALYTFDKYQSRIPKPQSRIPRNWVLMEEDGKKIPLLRKGVQTGTILAEAQNFARDLVNEPSNTMTPTILAEQAKEVAKRSGLKVEVLESERLRKLGMGGFLGVAQGSKEPPKWIHLRYEGAGKEGEWMALIGKGVTFDSGGISIKPSQGMGSMKGDMGGGAAVLAAMGAIGQLKPKINVIGIIPATENMPSGHAFKPGDILRMMNGKTVEIISTDAEGRLILADALVYANQLGATRLVDIATLTGGCVVAFGKITSAVLGNDEEMIQSLLKASSTTGERMWQLPLFEEYEELLKSDVADLRNSSGTREASTICGGIFLKTFAPSPRQRRGGSGWVHIDIAGKEMMDKEGDLNGVGGTGVGVRTLVQFVLQMAEISSSSLQ
ncbi:leucyl aminopeptidase [candidate division TA06 bacterium]|nr:leucyl aminopeptidase [candidate division TA06 bacterium]